MKKIAALMLCGTLFLTSCGSSSGVVNGTTGDATEEVQTEEISFAAEDTETEDNIPEDTEMPGTEMLKLNPVDKIPEGEWQAEIPFPDRRGKVDDTLALNSIAGFDCYSGQGKMYVAVSDKVTSFDMYINDRPVDTSEISGGKTYEIDFSDEAKSGRNSVQVSSIEPLDSTEAVKVCIPYPEIGEGTPEEVGIRQESLDAISDIISSDIENGFTSAQLAVIRHGKLVYANSWGKINSYKPDGTRITDSADVTNDTLYDLASVTKMFSVNYCLQKLVTDGEISLDSPITDFLGEDFVNETLDFSYDPEKLPQVDEYPGIETEREWKASLTIRDLLRHQGGFPPGPRYHNIHVDAVTQEYGPESVNILYAGNDATPETREETIKAVCKTPLAFKPGTKTLYSDVDYLILGVIVEQVTGKDLDSYLKENFLKPMGLSHITYNPLQNGFKKEDCAATEPAGNTRDGYLDYPGIRTETIQGEVHDDMAYCSMAGVSGHAGLFANATDLAKLASVMFTGGYGNHRFFSRNVMDVFTAPKKEDAANWGLGWWREGDDQRPWYFGSESASRVIGHQGWTGTLCMIDPENELVIVYLTNKINSPVTDLEENPNKFNGGYYTSATLGFVPQILMIGMDKEYPVDDQIFSLFVEMTKDSIKLVDAAHSAPGHPACKNAESKISLLTKMAERSGREEDLKLAESVSDSWDKHLKKCSSAQ